ncbi:hypothetical protein KP77_24380 [Jeotgalibacillus alimentarius]|uniref:YugN-like family protein n=2 Tax=Jeotgalibacillus TaxID=157226 RepID=A0A0C2R975_9BACL|nr:MULTISPECIES: YugN family protein [Jeotgalibacillus]KIL46870.1 hypothetical protein KP77_24380 [Jeotgalibacillus alimentarius]MBM7580502.1 hypothetical protein [Jeotgalibacillus terrae]
MHTFQSSIEGMEFPLILLEDRLKKEGYVIGGNWEYDHGSFDLLLEQQGDYLYLRLPFEAEGGELDKDDSTVRMLQPFLLSHQYDPDRDQDASSGAVSAAFNQFQSPEDQDAPLTPEQIEHGSAALERAEKLLNQVYAD